MKLPLLLLAAYARFTRAFDDDEDFDYVTCGSTLKLKHRTGFHLHSHDINWGSGSGQQSVTAMKSSDDTNSLWTVASPHGKPTCIQGSLIKCGQVVRLVHHNTKKYLHSHRHASPVSRRFEISGYGNSRENHSDPGDNWIVKCDSHSGYWQRDSLVKLMHPNTGSCLFAEKKTAFTQQNCRNCPIVGQLEVSGLQQCQHIASKDAEWKAADGIFFAKREL
eukprot:CAMPEP_0197539176 /NCGR_PEP_ID=MMETSP1318-20131121/61862_1 /TAXON_ID=552666 /ORGANISM="Partenskyella glossopodia, Strain RCC365" /LENGTH=219 /DNA_ID=CAMNT_0043097813 /DNA_START=44 /DNA_END=703 /DNA_ORIENTATION=+